MYQKAHNDLNLLAIRRNFKHPHDLYDKMRLQDSICFDPSSQSWLVTGYDAVTTILDDHRFLSELTSVKGPSSRQMSSISKQMIFMDGQEHQHLQDIMLRFLALIIKRMPDMIRHFAQKSLVKVKDAGEMEFVGEFASPLSLLTIAYILGIPSDNMEELRQLERWSDTFGDVTSGYFQGDLQGIQKLEEYFRLLIAKKRRSPSEDLLSALIETRDLFPSEDDLVANCMMIFSAGHITTRKLLGNGISLLMPEWEQFRTAFKETPRFTRTLGEELLRMVTPTRCLIRQARQDVDLNNHFIHCGQMMLLFLEAANHDPAVFSLPKQFHPQRRPNKHIAFGYGPHQCPGAMLARLEIQIALEELFSLSDLCSKPGTNPLWNTNPNLGGFQTNPIVFTVPSKDLAQQKYPSQ
jgi:cytochrome P450